MRVRKKDTRLEEICAHNVCAVNCSVPPDSAFQGGVRLWLCENESLNFGTWTLVSERRKKMNIRGFPKMSLWALTLIMVVSTLAACGPTPAPTEVGEMPTEVPTEVPAVEAPDTLVVVTAETPPTLDPDYWAGNSWLRVIGQVYEGVVEYEVVSESELGIPEGTDMAGVSDTTGAGGDDGIVGIFFESWEISEDGQTYTMHIREGYKSYYGDQATADDWIWRVERAFATHDMGEFQVAISGITGPEDVKKIDDMTVEIRTPEGPSPIFFKALTVQDVCAIDVDRLREEGWLTEDDPWGHEAMKHHDFGFGPWHAVEFTPGEEVVFEANPYYFRPLGFKKVIYREVPESGNRLAMLVAGEAHVCEELSLVQLEELRGGKGEARLVDLPLSTQVLRMYMNQDWGTFANLDCFHALAYAIPYEEIQRTAFLGFGMIGHSVCSPILGATANTEYQPYYYDIDKAKELWEAGSCPDTWTLTFSSDVPHHEDVGILMRTEFAKLGVDVVLNKQPTAALYQKVAERSLEAVIDESCAFVADGGYCTWLNWHKDSFGNEQVWIDEEISADIDRAMIMPAGAERNKLLWEIQEVLIDRGGRLHLLWPGWHLGANKHVKGFVWYYDNVTRWKDLYWEE
jgi:peptide/nickel transport system substrate-binding protein